MSIRQAVPQRDAWETVRYWLGVLWMVLVPALLLIGAFALPSLAGWLVWLGGGR